MRLNNIVIFPGNDEASRVTSAGRESLSIRDAMHFDSFAMALQRHTSATVRIDDSLYLPPVEPGFFCICRPGVFEASLPFHAEKFRLLASQTVVVGVVRTYALTWAENRSLAAVVESRSYTAWKRASSDEPAGLYGLKKVATAMGIGWDGESVPEGPEYAFLQEPGGRGLPALLAAYLEAYAALL